ncbi:MAG: hypothetical protein PVJ67_03165 [Candidatus Pacearchaeota archaeon]|jgi:hypothetical protein
MKKIFEILHNDLFPIKYSLWKKNQDKVYNQLENDLKLSWISTQHAIHSSMNLPIVFVLISFIFNLALLSLNIPNWKVAFSLYFLYLLFILIVLLSIYLLNRSYDKYTDEKYLEFSKKKKESK